MSVREVTMYKVVCDAAGCTYETNDFSDFAAWGNEGAAEDEWRDSDHQVTDDGKHFCDNHRVAECCNCGSSVVVVNDDPPTNGDWYCYKCGSDEGLLGTPDTVVQKGGQS